MELSQTFDALADSDMWTDVATVFGGIAGSSALQGAVDGRFDLPNEVYGPAVIGVAQMYAPAGSRREIQMGAGLHTLMSAAQRSDALAERVPEVPEVL